MKKNVKNDKVIRAMAIGISAMLATSSPMTAMAAEGTPDTDGDDNISVVTPEEGVADAAQAAVKSASDAVDTAKKSATTVKNDVKDSVEAGTDSEEKDLAQAVIDAAADVENTEAENGAPLAGATTAIVNTDTQLGVAEANDELSDAELSKAENASKDASDTAEELKDDMQKAEQKVDEQLEQIENAATVADADAAYAKLQETAQTAQADFDAKLEEYNTAKAAYDKAAAKVKEYEDAYNTAIANADANAAEAKATLETAKAKAAALEKAVETAKNAVAASAKEAMVIAEAENVAKEDGGLNWRNEDKLFIAIMENYYLPEKLGITGATVTRVQGKDNDAYNYFKAEYVENENGETKVKYFNYKMDGNSKDDIVIFEKREVEIFGGKADQYVDNNGDVIDTVAGLENGSVVDVNGAYVKKNDRTHSETFVSNSEITDTSKTDVTIDESTKQESYQLDEKGNLVKTVTGTVTTITYTDNTFTSQSYATVKERDDAAAAKEAKLEEATGKDATVTKTQETTHTYTANGTYIPTFTETVTVTNREVEWDHTGEWYDDGVRTEKEAFEEVKNAVIENYKNHGLHCINVESNLRVTGYTEEERGLFGVVTDDSDFIVSGTVTATYAKVTKTTISQNTVGSFWNDIKALLGSGQSTNEKLEALAKAKIEAEGGIFVSANWVDGNYNKATICYVASVEVETDEKQTEQAAKDAVREAALQQAKANGATDVYNVRTNDTKKIEHTTYSYTVDYLKASETTEKNKVIATETYGNADVLEGQIIQNKNYYDTINGKANNILLTQRDEDYRAFVDDAKAITDKYVRLLGEAQQANADVLEAQKQVETLQNEIEALKGKSNNVDALTELTAKLETAKANRDTAEETLNTILEKLENAGVTRDQVIERLTPPAPTGGDGGQIGGETGGTPSGTTTVTGTVEASGVTVATTPTVPADAPTVAAGVANFTPAAATATTTPTVLADAPTVAAGVANFTPAAATTTTATADTVDITDEEVPLGASEEVEEEPQVEETVEINDEEVPLAAEVVEDEQNKMSWWWLLIVAILGATGYEMYRKHNQKKQKVAENTKETK